MSCRDSFLNDGLFRDWQRESGRAIHAMFMPVVRSSEELATATANAGVLRYAQNDGEKQTTAETYALGMVSLAIVASCMKLVPS